MRRIGSTALSLRRRPLTRWRAKLFQTNAFAAGNTARLTLSNAHAFVVERAVAGDLVGRLIAARGRDVGAAMSVRKERPKKPVVKQCGHNIHRVRGAPRRAAPSAAPNCRAMEKIGKQICVAQQTVRERRAAIQ